MVDMITVSDRISFLKEVKKALPIMPVVCELGVLNGEFSEMILRELVPEKLYLVDPFKENEVYYEGALSGHKTSYSSSADFDTVINKFSEFTSIGVVEIHIGYSYEVARYFRDNRLNLIYHDASHVYQDIKRDLVDWLPKIKEGGVIAGHDMLPIEGFGVERAVKEFCEEYGWEIFLFNSTGGDWAASKIK